MPRLGGEMTAYLTRRYPRESLKSRTSFIVASRPGSPPRYLTSYSPRRFDGSLVGLRVQELVDVGAMRYVGSLADLAEDSVMVPRAYSDDVVR